VPGQKKIPEITLKWKLFQLVANRFHEKVLKITISNSSVGRYQ
jgi:hypothetical protein